VTRGTLLTDLAIAALVAILVIVISPGLAVVALLALLVLIICGITFGVGRLRRRASADPLRELRRSRANARRQARSQPPRSTRRQPPRRAPRG
jgi:hypothetical protein